jgi:hypothetical protein
MKVCLLASALDGHRAAELAEALTAFGVDIEAADADLVVVLLSSAGLADPTWVARYDQLAARPGVRFIPVSLEDLDAPRLPESLGGLNWIRWQADEPLPAEQVVQAAGGDPELYTQSRSLRGEADIWDESGRPEELLIADPRRAKAAEAFLTRSQEDTLARPTARLQEFIDASTRLRKRNRRKRRNRWVRRGFALSVVAVVAYVVISTVRLNAQTSRVAVAIDLTLNPDFPSRTAELAGATLIQGYDAVKPTARKALIDVLPRPWGEGEVGLNHDAALLDGVTVPGRNTLWTVEGAGSVVRWNRETGVPLERRLLSVGRLEAIDASPDGSTLVAGGQQSVWVISPAPWRSRRIDVGSDVSGVTLDRARRAAVARTAGGLVVVSTRTASGVERRIPRSKDVLDVRAVADGRVLALLRRGPRLVLLDAVTGAVSASRVIPGWQFEKGALGPDGRSAVITGPDHQLHYAERSLRFRPTGLAVTDVTEVLELLPRRRVAFGGSEFGVRVAEADSGLVLGQVCTDVLTVEILRALPGEPSVLCGNGYTVSIWNPDELGPTPAPPPSVPLHRSRVAREPSFRLEATAPGRITLGFHHEGKVASTSLSLPGERWTTAAIWEGRYLNVAVGGAGGHVEAFDIVDGKFQRVLDWHAPDATSVRALGWEPQGDAPLRVETASGRWWSVPSCILCSRDGRLVDLARKRLHMCEIPAATDALTDRAKSLLQLRVCPRSMKPAPG